jgi:hypothetical protein
MPPPFKARKLAVSNRFLGDYTSIRLEFADDYGEVSSLDIPLDLAARLLPLLSERVEAHRRMQFHLDSDADGPDARTLHLLASLVVAEFSLDRQDERYTLEASAQYGATVELTFDVEQLHRLRRAIDKALNGSGGGPSHSGSDITH